MYHLGHWNSGICFVGQHFVMLAVQQIYVVTHKYEAEITSVTNWYEIMETFVFANSIC